MLEVVLGDGESGIRLGEPRVWRSDEWGTLTPLCFRQQYNTLGSYNRYSQTLGSILTDNMLVYGQPSWDILTYSAHFIGDIFSLEVIEDFHGLVFTSDRAVFVMV